MTGHRWIRAAHRHDRIAARDGLDLPPVLAAVDAHRWSRGPYTAAGTLLRAIAPDAMRRCPDAVRRHDVEILSVAPELRTVVPATRETLTSLAVPKERTRFYSRLRTLRITHGLVDFLREYLRVRDGGAYTLVVDDLDRADPTDREFVATLVRRIDPGVLTVVVGTADDTPADPPGPVAVPLSPTLAAYCEPVDVPCPGHDVVPGGDPAAIARAYIDGDCAGDDPTELAAYLGLDAAARAALHDARLAELQTRNEPSQRLGAIALHAERGSDPAGAGVAALRHALDYCMDIGYYHAVVDLGIRGRALTSPDVDTDSWWAFTTKMTTSLAALGRADEALPLYDEARARSTRPQVHMQAAYATAMLYTRHLEPDRRDDVLARAYANQSIAFASLLPDPKEREFNGAFNRNGLALIAVHQGNLDEALRLVEECLDRLDRELAPGEHELHRSVLRYNRAQVYAGLGRHDDALADYTAVMTVDPNYPEYHFDRAGIYRRLGREHEALADYERAIMLSPPFVEAFYNRGDVRAGLGDIDGAVADFGYVIDLDPTYVDAYANRAGLREALGDTDGAWQDVAAGLELSPRHPHLLTVRSRLRADAGDTDDAMRDLSEAVDADPRFAQAWASRGTLRYDLGDLAGAVADLERAAALSGDAEIRFNLAVAYQATDSFDEALAGFDALLDADDDPLVRCHRAQCLLRLDRRDAARSDFETCLAADPSLADEVRQHMPELVGG